jgi:hypothetical protein
MTALVSQVRSSAIIALLLVLPFAILEATSIRSISSLPLPLFATLWLLTVTFVLTLRSLVHRSHVAPLYSHLAKLALMILVGGLWVSLVLDQMPCFLGVPNCD